MDWKSFLAVGFGSFLGGALRYGTMLWVGRKTTGDFPVAILLANVLGSLAIGILAPLYERLGYAKDHWLPLLLSVGLLGGYTTFSTFSLQTLKLLEAGNFKLAALNAGLSVFACLFAAFCGLRIGQVLWGSAL